ncbi:MAG: OmpA family protein [Deltaproteobacteria bacterium]|jgi:outer membrane protein OmpA-like peptidoglycan-associated protein|nr:OmpA family protein [Deltaproteobacteria bacterium]
MIAKMMTGRKLVLGTLIILLALIPQFVAAAEMCEERETALQQAVTVQDYEQFILDNSPCELAFVAVQRLAVSQVNARNWKAAADIYRKYKDSFPGMADRFDKIISLLEAPEENLSKSRLGSGVNSRGAEFRPIISADSQTLYFTRNRGEESGGEDIYYSIKERRNWQNADNVGPPITTPSHEMILGISADSSKMTLMANYPESFGRGDIFYAVKGKECWSEAMHYPEPINTEYFDSDAMLPADGRTILFISDRPGNIGAFKPKESLFHGSYAGNTDIYVYIESGPDEGKLINLGPTINTPFAEYSPFLHPDGKTLYFSSEGHYGLGGLDVFMATRKSDSSWTEWSEPVNLGKEINGPYNDWGFQITTEGDLAYYSTSEKKSECWEGDISTPQTGCGPSDIFDTELPAAARPKFTVTVYGKVTDPDKNPLAARIAWNDLTLDKSAGIAQSDPGSGDYFTVLPSGHKYGYSAEKEGYMGASETFDFTDIKATTKFRHDIVLYPLEKLVKEKITLRINNIFFDFDKSTLRPESKHELDRWVDTFKKNPELNAEIHGHTCWIGTEEYNQGLSERRAQAVIDYLVAHGVAKERLTMRGFGETKPAASNETREGREKNRRVEVLFTE